jgi:hypothetical protein
MSISNQKGLIMTEARRDLNAARFSSAIVQAEMAAARGDIDDAERWTRLAERYTGMVVRLVAEFRNAGIDVASLVASPRPRKARRKD